MSELLSFSDRKQNALARASSAYLRSAMYQPVQWEQWGDAAFARARAEDKPVLLDIGAVWCHWCHVMDRESYEKEQTAALINEHFVAVKVDRDERPDVDTRYQAAVAAISGQGGWPLTAFLTPEGKPFFGGTYFPPDDRHGRPSLSRVLLTMAEAFQKRRDEVNESAGSVMEAIEQNETFSGRGGLLGPELVGKMVAAILKQFDPRFAGFGSQPKFPHSSALDLLIDAASREREGAQTETAEAAGQAARVTLEQMARGGIYDHLAGGFHRYSVDERWVVPHFEKMAYDNCELLKNYVHAYLTFGQPSFAQTAKEIIGWMDAWLSDRELGGFYASQDADFSLDDDGDYFTWTRDEAAELLTRDELRFAGVYFDIGEVGDMHHNPAKNVLHITGSVEVAAKAAGVEAGDAARVLVTVKNKLYAARLERRTPYVDKTMYTAWNAMCISAYLEAGRVLEMPEVVQFALKSLERVLEAVWRGDGSVSHVVAYGERGGADQQVAGVLDDYAFLGQAALDAWETSGAAKYYRVAEGLAAQVLARFHDEAAGGFFDTERMAEGEQRLGALNARRKPLQDAPTPAGNPIAASLLLRLEALSGRQEYVVVAQETMEAFAGVVEHFGLYAATYGLALQRIAQRPIQICILGDDEEARRMEVVARKRFAVNKCVIRLGREQMADLPPALAQSLPNLPGIEEGGTMAIVCSGNTCQPPARTADALLTILKGV